MPIRIIFVCPTYQEEQLHPYTRATLESFFRHTPDGRAIVVDDGSRGWSPGLAKALKSIPEGGPGRCRVFHFDTWGGLTRSWNAGLKHATRASEQADYVVVGNNDLLFTPGWAEPLMWAVDQGYSLVGPVSNAPGHTSGGLAQVERYLPDYRRTDDPEELASQAARLRQRMPGVLVETGVNGFFQFATRDSWLTGKYDDRYFYRPRNDYTSTGKKNPTPLMTLNEDELQGRWRKLGRRTAVVPASFIFHYRAVTRGGRYLQGQWMRKGQKS